MQDYPFIVFVPSEIADETSMGEWLEERDVDYVSGPISSRDAETYSFNFSSKDAADAFARNFVG